MLHKKAIEELTQLFAKYRIYPHSCYSEHSPVGLFQKMFPDDHYSRDLETFLASQNYPSMPPKLLLLRCLSCLFADPLLKIGKGLDG